VTAEAAGGTSTSQDTRIAVLGAGFWAQFQIAAWQEVPGARVVALYNRTRSKAEALAKRFGIEAVYDDAVALIREVRPDVIDVITDVDTHARFVELAARSGIPVICQKPLAPSLEVAARLVDLCREAGVPFAVHENWRWQRPLRELKRALESGAIGTPWRAHVQYASSFPVFENQPFLKELEQFILTDMGTHILDVVRFLFGEPSRIYAQTYRVHPDIKGEDAATLLLTIPQPGAQDVTPRGAAGVSDALACTVQLGYASRLERERFPEVFILVEGQHGSIELAPDYWLRTTTAGGTHAVRVPPPRYDWADPRYDLVQASIVGCNADCLAHARGEHQAETSGEDNLKTLSLVFAAYESARTGAAVAVASAESTPA
jgi:D-apiose dehydrogenase